MSLAAASRGEWLSATLVLTTSIASTLLLRAHAAAVDVATQQRESQVERYLELPILTEAPAAADVTALDGLFVGHVLVGEVAPWGGFLALHAAGDRVAR